MQSLKRIFLSFFTFSIFFIQNILRANEQSTLEIIQDYVATQRLPGVIFSETTSQKTSHITDGRRNAYHQEAIQKDELFPIASLSKIFTSILILQEIEMGKLSLHSKLKDIFIFYKFYILQVIYFTKTMKIYMSKKSCIITEVFR